MPTDSSEYERWAATTGLELEREITLWAEKSERQRVENESLRVENERLKSAVAWQKLSIEAAVTENERLRSENALAANELVEYAKLAAAGTAEQQATIRRLRMAAQKVVDDPLLKDACDSWSELRAALEPEQC